jgi:death on curing protein
MLTSQKIIDIQSIIILSSDLEEDRHTHGLVRDQATLDFIVEKVGDLSDVNEKAAWLLFSISAYHPFFQGNKRTALAASENILQLSPNPSYYAVDEELIAEFVIEISKYEVTLEEVELWVKQHTQKLL